MCKGTKQTEEPRLPKNPNFKYFVLLSDHASWPDNESELPADSSISGNKASYWTLSAAKLQPYTIVCLSLETQGNKDCLPELLNEKEGTDLLSQHLTFETFSVMAFTNFQCY